MTYVKQRAGCPSRASSFFIFNNIKVITMAKESKQAKRKNKEKVRDRAYDAIRNAMDKLVDLAVEHAGDEPRIIYSAYKVDKELDVPIWNLNDIAAPGCVRFVADADDFFGGKDSKAYRSGVMYNLTWLEVAALFNEAVAVTLDDHHVFLEGVEKLPKNKQTEAGVTLYEFVTGS